MTAPGPPLWVERFRGIPFAWDGESFDGANCWGLARLVLGERYGIDLPSFLGSVPGVEHRAAMGELFDAEAERWIRVWRREALDELLPRGLARAGDLLRIRSFGRPHVGVVVADGWMLHCHNARPSNVERFEESRWTRTISGLYRHPSLAVPSSPTSSARTGSRSACTSSRTSNRPDASG